MPDWLEKVRALPATPAAPEINPPAVDWFTRASTLTPFQEQAKQRRQTSLVETPMEREAAFDAYVWPRGTLGRTGRMIKEAAVTAPREAAAGVLSAVARVPGGSLIGPKEKAIAGRLAEAVAPAREELPAGRAGRPEAGGLGVGRQVGGLGVAGATIPLGVVGALTKEAVNLVTGADHPIGEAAKEETRNLILGLMPAAEGVGQLAEDLAATSDPDEKDRIWETWWAEEAPGLLGGTAAGITILKHAGESAGKLVSQRRAKARQRAEAVETIRGEAEAATRASLEKARKATEGAEIRPVEAPGIRPGPTPPENIPTSVPAPRDLPEGVEIWRPEAPAPETPATLDVQMKALEDGRKPALLVTAGEQAPRFDARRFKAVPTNKGLLIVPVAANVRPGRISEARLAKVLGYPEPKPAPGAERVVVTGRTADGTEAITVEVPPSRAAEAEAHAKVIAGPEGRVETGGVEQAGKVVTERRSAMRDPLLTRRWDLLREMFGEQAAEYDRLEQRVRRNPEDSEAEARLSEMEAGKPQASLEELQGTYLKAETEAARAGAAEIREAYKPTPPGEAIIGQGGILRTPAGDYPYRYEVVDAREVVPSHDAETFARRADYPEGVQERPYHRDISEQAKVVDHAQRFDPRFTVTNVPDATNGPPILASDSNVVLGGNSRAMTHMRLVSGLGREGAIPDYMGELVSKAQMFGLDPAAIEAMHAQGKVPMLVRRIEGVASTDTAAARQAIRRLNQGFTQELEPVAAAVSRARSMSPEGMTAIGESIALAGEDVTLREALKSGPIQRQVVEILASEGVLPPTEINRYVSAKTGALNDAGMDLIEKVLAGSVIPDADLLTAAPAGQVAKIVRAAPAIARARIEGEAWDLGPVLTDALALNVRAEQAGMPLEDFVDQGALFGDSAPSAQIVEMAKALRDMKPTEFVKAARQFASDAKMGTEAQGVLGMFEKPSGVGSLKEAFALQFRQPKVEEQIPGPTKPLPGQVNLFTGEVVKAEGKEAPAKLFRQPAQGLTRSSVQRAFNLTDEQAEATMALAESMGIDLSRVEAVSGGTPAQEALRQEGRLTSPLGFYDNIADALRSWQPKGTPNQLMAHLKKSGGTMDEAEWIGLAEFLKGKQTVTRQQVEEFVRANQVEVQEVRLGERDEPAAREAMAAEAATREKAMSALRQNDLLGFDRIGDALRAVREHADWASRWEVTDAQDAAAIESWRRTDAARQSALREPTKFPSYQTPGGENYRELLLTLPLPDQVRPPEITTKPDTSPLDGRPMVAYYLNGEWAGRANTWAEAVGAARQLIGENAPQWAKTMAVGGFRSQHWSDIPNVLAHVRFNDRTAPDGKRVLFIEEVQSDWHQKGRREGYRKQAPRPGDVITVIRSGMPREVRIREDQPRPIGDGGLLAEDTSNRDQFYVMPADWQGTVPDAPFKKTWPALAMKRILRYAVDSGYDRVAWTTGDMQAERYDLSKQVDHIAWDKTPHGDVLIAAHPKGGGSPLVKQLQPNELPEFIGKEATDKILAGGRSGDLTGLDLKVGGKGMRSFYDQILPSTVNKIVKRMGGEVTQGRIGDTEVAKMRASLPPTADIRERPWATIYDDRITGRYATRSEASNALDMMAGDHLLDLSNPNFGALDAVPSLDITPAMRASVREGLPLFQGPKGATEFAESGRAIIRGLQNPDVSTGIHEIAHVARRHLFDRSIPAEQRRGISDQDITVAEQWAGAKDGRWDVAAEEKFSRGFERYLRDGQAPSSALARIFDSFKQWLSGIYERLKGSAIDIDISPEMRGVFDRLVTRAEKVEPAAPIEAAPTIQTYSPTVARFRPPVTQAEQAEVKGRYKIIRDIKEKLNVPVRMGRIRVPGALGVFKVREEVIRTRLAQDIGSVAHEVGHFLEKRLFGKPLDAAIRIPGPDQAVATSLYRDLMTFAQTQKTPSPSEGMAEFVRQYIEEPAEAMKSAHVYDFLEHRMERDFPDIRRALLEAREDYNRWLTAPAAAKVISEISFGAEDKPNPLSFDEFYSQMFDRLDPIKTIETAMNQGRPLSPRESAYVAHRVLAGMPGRARQWLEVGRTTWDAPIDRTAGPSLKAILDPVWKRRKDFAAYALARRGLERYEKMREREAQQAALQGRPPREVRPVPWSEADLREVVTQFESPEFRAAFREAGAYQAALLDYLKASGGLSDQQLADIRRMSEEYVPYHRVMEVEHGGKGGRYAIGSGSVNLFQPVKQFKGSQRAVIDPAESIFMNTYQTITWAERNAAARMFFEQAARSEGMGRFVEELDVPVRPTSVSVKEVLEKAGLEKHLDEAEAQVVTLFRPDLWERGPDIATVFFDGKPRSFKVHPDLKNALTGADRETVGFWGRILRYPASFLRVGATLAPGFIVRNPTRDQPMAFIMSKYGYKPYIDFFRGAFHAIRRDDAYWDYVGSGAAYSELVSLDRKYLQRGLDDLMRSRTRRMLTVASNPLHLLQVASLIGEQATRISEVQRGLAKEGRSRAGAQAAGYSGREVTLDFQRVGSKQASLNAISAFWNAQLQGLDRPVRAFKERPVWTSVAIASGLVMPSMILYGLNHDKKWYQQLEQWERDLFWHVAIGDEGDEEPWAIYRIPKPFELGILFGSMPERAMEYLRTKDPHAWDEALPQLLRAVPVPMPTAAMPLVENITNYSFFFERPIVSRGLEDVAEPYQYGPYVSETARAAGKLTGTSPAKIENLVRGYFGGLGGMALRGAEAPFRPALPERTWGEFLGLESRYPSFASRPGERFYREYEEARKAERTPGVLAKRGEMEEAERYYFDTAEVAARAKGFRKAAEILSAIRQESIRIAFDREMDSAEKRERMKDLARQYTAVAEQALGELAPGPTQPQ